MMICLPEQLLSLFSWKKREKKESFILFEIKWIWSLTGIANQDLDHKMKGVFCKCMSGLCRWRCLCYPVSQCPKAKPQEHLKDLKEERFQNVNKLNDATDAL